MGPSVDHQHAFATSITAERCPLPTVRLWAMADNIKNFLYTKFLVRRAFRADHVEISR